MPVSCEVCGEFAALSFTLSVPVRVPRAVGVKVTVMVQVVFAAKVAGEIGHAEVSAKSPEIEMLLIVRGTVWLLLRVTVLEGLVVCWAQGPKLRLVGLMV